MSWNQGFPATTFLSRTILGSCPSSSGVVNLLLLTLDLDLNRLVRLRDSVWPFWVEERRFSLFCNRFRKTDQKSRFLCFIDWKHDDKIREPTADKYDHHGCKKPRYTSCPFFFFCSHEFLFWINDGHLPFSDCTEHGYVCINHKYVQENCRMNKTRQTRVHQPELLLWQLQEVCLRPWVHRQSIVEEIISNCPTKLKNYVLKTI